MHGYSEHVKLHMFTHHWLHLKRGHSKYMSRLKGEGIRWSVTKC